MRQSGLLLHPSSLPGAGPIGTLGAAAYAWLDWLAQAGQRVWQVLPLSPPGPAASPYMATSALAGNVWLIDPVELVADGILDADDPDVLRAQSPAPTYEPAPLMDAEAAAASVERWLRQAAARFSGLDASVQADFAAFCSDPDQIDWLDDWALFAALDVAHHGACWLEWPDPLRRRQPAALANARLEYAEGIHLARLGQWLFFRQWDRVRAYAHARGVQVLGDVPIYVAMHSAEVWANPALFQLDPDGQPDGVSGVPPDAFAEDGQLWGNPLYNWEALAATDYAWWIQRLRAMFRQADFVRIDHFRGFESYWRVPAGAASAKEGAWVAGPGAAFFDAVRRHLGDVPIVAEDLGIITDEVTALRVQFGMPGMRVLQFGTGDDVGNPHRLPNHTEDAVVYTGTHDNDTTVGWYQALSDIEQHAARLAFSTDGSDIAWTLLDRAWGSPARLAIAPLQDVLRLDGAHRMNVPGTVDGNWRWRLAGGRLTGEVADRLRALTQKHNRAAE